MNTTTRAAAISEALAKIHAALSEDALSRRVSLSVKQIQMDSRNIVDGPSASNSCNIEDEIASEHVTAAAGT